MTFGGNSIECSFFNLEKFINNNLEDWLYINWLTWFNLYLNYNNCGMNYEFKNINL